MRKSRIVHNEENVLINSDRVTIIWKKNYSLFNDYEIIRKTKNSWLTRALSAARLRALMEVNNKILSEILYNEYVCQHCGKIIMKNKISGVSCSSHVADESSSHAKLIVRGTRIIGLFRLECNKSAEPYYHGRWRERASCDVEAIYALCLKY